MIHFLRKMKIFCQDFCVVCSVPFIFKRRRHLLSFPRRIILGRSISHPISLCETLCWRKNVTLSFFFLVISFVRRKKMDSGSFLLNVPIDWKAAWTNPSDQTKLPMSTSDRKAKMDNFQSNDWRVRKRAFIFLSLLSKQLADTNSQLGLTPTLKAPKRLLGLEKPARFFDPF